jgi:uncharacterized membrane protein
MKGPNPNVTVTTEVDYCPFCRRSRTLRREERHLGGLVRTMVACETCHQTLSSTMGPAPEPEAAAEPAAEASAAQPEIPAPAAEPEPAAKPARKKPAAPTKQAASPTRKPAAKKKA